VKGARRTLLPRLAALALAGLVAACAGQGTGHLAAPAESSASTAPAPRATVPHFTAHAIVAGDGAVLPLRVWRPEGEITAVVLALHGFNDYSNAFDGPATQWAKHGVITYAYDQRGFGKAPLRGRWAGAWRLDDDAAMASRLLRARYPGVPLYLLGESMGGAVAITAATGAAGAPRPLCDGVILVAPAVWGRDTMNIFERVGLWTADALFPGLTLTGRGLHIQASDNIPMLRALGRDPLVIKATRVDTIYGLVNLMDMALAAAPRLKEPMLLLYGQRDEIIPAAPVRLFIEHLPPAPPGVDRRVAWYGNGYHMLLRDLEAPMVARDVESWIADREAPLPSGADRGAVLGLVTASE
jgi:alpha-beta hydrolase superfamily lysophospholipase